MIIEGSSIAVKYCVIIKTLLVLSGTTPTVQNVTIYDTEIEAKASVTIQNCIGRNTVLPAVDIDVDNGMTVTGQYNCFQDAAKSGSGTYTDTGTLWSTDPLMTDPANGDFTLQPNSPCIDAGVDVGLTEDYAGNPIGREIEAIVKRIMKRIIIAPIGYPDIGAYEYRD